MKRSLLAVALIGGHIVACLALNGLVFGLKWNAEARKNPAAKPSKLLPPGIVVGIIWTVLFGLFGYAQYALWSAKGPKKDSMVASAFLAALAAFCLAYPFATRGLRQGRTSRVLNLTTLILVSAATAAVSMARSLPAFLALLPAAVWASYVNFVDAVTAEG